MTEELYTKKKKDPRIEIFRKNSSPRNTQVSDRQEALEFKIKIHDLINSFDTTSNIQESSIYSAPSYELAPKKDKNSSPEEIRKNYTYDLENYVDSLLNSRSFSEFSSKVSPKDATRSPIRGFKKLDIDKIKREDLSFNTSGSASVPVSPNIKYSKFGTPPTPKSPIVAIKEEQARPKPKIQIVAATEPEIKSPTRTTSSGASRKQTRTTDLRKKDEERSDLPLLLILNQEIKEYREKLKKSEKDRQELEETCKNQERAIEKMKKELDKTENLKDFYKTETFDKDSRMDKMKSKNNEKNQRIIELENALEKMKSQFYEYHAYVKEEEITKTNLKTQNKEYQILLSSQEKEFEKVKKQMEIGLWKQRKEFIVDKETWEAKHEKLEEENRKLKQTIKDIEIESKTKNYEIEKLFYKSKIESESENNRKLKKDLEKVNLELNELNDKYLQESRERRKKSEKAQEFEKKLKFLEEEKSQLEREVELLEARLAMKSQK